MAIPFGRCHSDGDCACGRRDDGDDRADQRCSEDGQPA
jgi:hypothetical protein